MTKLPPELELKFKEKVDTLRMMEPDLTIDELPLPIEMIWLEQGIEQGMEKGIQQGLERGIQKGRAAGMLEAQRLSILSALEARFGLAPEAARLQVDRLATEEQLSQALRLAVTSPSLEEFLKSV